MKWGLPYEIQRFLPKPTGDAEEAPNEVFDTMCSTSVSNVPACRSPITQHCSPMTRHHVYLSLTCPGPSLGMRLNHFPPGHTWAVPVMWWLSAHNAVVRQGKQARLERKNTVPIPREICGSYCFPELLLEATHAAMQRHGNQLTSTVSLRQRRGSPRDRADTASKHLLLLLQPPLPCSTIQTQSAAAAHGDTWARTRVCLVC